MPGNRAVGEAFRPPVAGVRTVTERKRACRPQGWHALLLFKSVVLQKIPGYTIGRYPEHHVGRPPFSVDTAHRPAYFLRIKGRTFTAGGSLPPPAFDPVNLPTEGLLNA
jgi:hypothetical protein